MGSHPLLAAQKSFPLLAMASHMTNASDLLNKYVYSNIFNVLATDVKEKKKKGNWFHWGQFSLFMYLQFS